MVWWPLIILESFYSLFGIYVIGYLIRKFKGKIY